MSPSQSLSFARCAALEGLSRARGCYRYLGPPSSGSLLREYSGLRVCSSWQPRRRTLELRGKRGYVAFLKTTYPLPPSGLMGGAMGYVAFLKATWPMSPSHRVAPDAV
ncbi:hypothetical protein Taro_056128 [Colocasia esculenta]|uniref:Uncharacterized protein n=1 Tax=Colocasia esculenta TaxID=4460 RepID=A0A843XWE3_COLES|nr:hypothetical protein [Colocasia esculenta]